MIVIHADINDLTNNNYTLNYARSITKADVILVHADANDLTKSINTMKYVKSITKIIDEINYRRDTHVGFSGISGREYVTVLVRKLKTFRKV